MRLVDVPQYGLAKWVTAQGSEKKKSNKRAFSKTTQLKECVYSFGKASMGLVCADLIGALLKESVKDLEKSYFSSSYQKIATKTREKFDEWIFDSNDKAGVNQEK